VILLSGTIGDHGVAVLSQRESLAFETTIESDTAALHTLVADLMAAVPGAVRVLRDPTRGGLATTLNEIARQSGVGMRLQEAAIPVQAAGGRGLRAAGAGPAVRRQRRQADRHRRARGGRAALAALRAHPLGADAARIGEVTTDPHHFVQMDTRFGGRRVVDWLSGEQLPRIC
jgi:hydrogenase expression/formation protein HypE